MINKTFLKKIGTDLKSFQKERGLIINKSREILQASKESIFATHRLDDKKASDSIAKAETVLKELSKKYDKGNRLRFEGSYKAAVEEYVEAKLFGQMMAGKKIDAIKFGNIGPEEYIGGLADVTGELVRQAVLQSTKGNYKNIKVYRDFTEELVGFMMNLYMTGHSRQKFDEVKRNLKRFEGILYDISIRELDKK
jgi:predicted translin family RNA/ssDNA-binding protein